MQIRIYARHPKDGRSFAFTLEHFPDDRARDFARSVRSLAKAAYGDVLEALVAHGESELRRDRFFDTMFNTVCRDFHLVGQKFDFAAPECQKAGDVFGNFLSLCASIYAAQTFGWLPATALQHAPDAPDR